MATSKTASIRITSLTNTGQSVLLRSNTSWINPYLGPDWEEVTSGTYNANAPGANSAAFSNSTSNINFIGSDAANTFSGGSGNDSMTGGRGSDFLFGNNGNDTLDGGVDNDYLVGGEGNDRLLGGAGNDLMMGDTRTRTATGQLVDTGNGDDVLIGGSGVDTLYGGAGNDTLYGDGEQKEANTDAADVLFGGFGNDVIYGRGGNDWLDGGSINQAGTKGVPLVSDGDDSLFGGSGNDTLRGGSGIDTLTGGTGNDVFVFLKGDARSAGSGGATRYDTIMDFELGKDAIFLDYIPGSVSSAMPLVVTAVQSSDGALLTFDYKTGQATDSVDYQIFVKYTASFTAASLFNGDKLNADTINKMVWTAALSGIQYS